MDSNYQWQKHRADERIQSRMREAEAHRLAKKETPRRASIAGRAWSWISGLARRLTRRQDAHDRKDPVARERPSG